MPKTKIIIQPGMKFGKLTVIERDPNSGGAGKHVKWICQCECGNITSIESSHLRQGQQSCSNACAKSIPIGTRFGKLVVIERTDKRKLASNGGHVIYKCKCDCGNICEVNGADLKRGSTHSCGCVHSLGESKIEKILVENNIPYIRECTFPNFKTPKDGVFRFDFYVNNQYIIEYDGIQHFLTEGKGLYTEEYLKEIKEKDEIKNNYCKEYNIPLIRIPYTHYDDLCIDDLKLETTSFLFN